MWFIVYLILAMLIYGSLFIAIGAAASDLKDAQALMTPGMLLFMAPIFIWMPVAPRAGQHHGHRRVAGALRDADAHDPAHGPDAGADRVARSRSASC